MDGSCSRLTPVHGWCHGARSQVGFLARFLGKSDNLPYHRYYNGSNHAYTAVPPYQVRLGGGCMDGLCLFMTVAQPNLM